MEPIAASVVTRFAPSPTGHLHVGGARTALFAWAFARRHAAEGKFILRIEDTDQARSSAASTRGILDDLTWLGLHWDEGPSPDAADPYAEAAQLGPHAPYFQSQRLAIYREHAERLCAAGRAYDQGGALRFRMPQRDITVRDVVLGDVTIRREQLEDFVILKSDGYPTFHLAVVVDDALMGVTHVLRGQEHLMNTPRHVALQEALGFPTPVYAHLPAILNPDGSKMSKRDKAKAARKAAETCLASEPDAAVRLAQEPALDPASLQAFLAQKNDDVAIAEAVAAALRLPLPEINVHDFRRSGYLPEVLLNYLALLGWWPPDKERERFDLDYLVANFSLEAIGKSNARFDRAKLLAFNGEALAALAPEAFREKLRAHFRAFHPEFLRRLGEQFDRFAESYRPRAKTLDEPAQAGRFFVEPDDALAYDEKAVAKVLQKGGGAGYAVLRELLPVLVTVEPWTPEALHATLERFAAASGRKLGDIAQPLRVAVSGTTVSPPIHDTLAILGREATLARVERCLRQFEAAGKH